MKFMDTIMHEAAINRPLTHRDGCEYATNCFWHRLLRRWVALVASWVVHELAVIQGFYEKWPVYAVILAIEASGCRSNGEK